MKNGLRYNIVIKMVQVWIDYHKYNEVGNYIKVSKEEKLGLNGNIIYENK